MSPAPLLLLWAGTKAIISRLTLIPRARLGTSNHAIRRSFRMEFVRPAQSGLCPTPIEAADARRD